MASLTISGLAYYAMSLAVLSLAPKRTIPSPNKPDTKNQKRPTAATRKDIGQHLRRHLAPLVNVYARWTQHPNRSTQATYTVNRR